MWDNLERKTFYFFEEKLIVTWFVWEGISEEKAALYSSKRKVLHE